MAVCTMPPGPGEDSAMADVAGIFGYPVVDLPPSAASTPDTAVHFLVAQLVQSGRLSPEHGGRVSCQVLHRESLGSTRIGEVAFPHSKSDTVGKVLGMVGRSAAPIPWPGMSGPDSVRVVCLLVTPMSDPAVSLQVLQVAVKRLRRDHKG
jgi:mannitol/fructose-specific phosphotransferase system IIA component (Ntr-type)